MKKEDKGIIIEKLQALLNEYPHFYLTDMEALDSEKTSNLRRMCNKQQVKLVMVKNTLLRSALAAVDTDFAPMYEYLKGNTTVMFSQNANAPARIIKDFTKDSKGKGRPQLKAAYVQESLYLGAENLDALVSVKSREELIADVIALLQSPVKNVMSSLQSAGQTIHGVLKTLEER